MGLFKKKKASIVPTLATELKKVLDKEDKKVDSCIKTSREIQIMFYYICKHLWL